MSRLIDNTNDRSIDLAFGLLLVCTNCHDGYVIAELLIIIMRVIINNIIIETIVVVILSSFLPNVSMGDTWRYLGVYCIAEMICYGVIQ